MSNAPVPPALDTSDPQPRRTAPLSVLVVALQNAQSAILPAIFLSISFGDRSILIGLGIGLAIVAIGTLFGYVAWRRLTYTIREQDIRVERGMFARSARSVPYERIQDVSLEQKLIPRLLGLVAVKFETGAGGGDDLSLTFLKEEHGEELRQLVRAWRDEHEAGADVDRGAQPIAREAEPLFTMGPRRLFTFGLFEFSLAVFAVLAGLTQYADGFVDFEIWDPNIWETFLEEQLGVVAALGTYAQIVSAIAGLFAVFLIGSATGLARTFMREWNFLLERTARGFRRRRGLFTRTDVVMPIHRVQGIVIGTRAIRYRFGWHSLKFVSLAQDAGAANHVVAPFAKLDEIAPIAAAAGFAVPDETADWHRASKRYMVDSAIVEALTIFGIGLAVWAAFLSFLPDWSDVVIGVTLMLAGISALAQVFSWRFQRHMLDPDQIAVRSGVFSPRSRIANRTKLHSAQIAQGPIARWRGYATLHLGQAGGEFAILGIPIERARAVRAMVLETIAATDFSRLESQSAG